MLRRQVGVSQDKVEMKSFPQREQYCQDPEFICSFNKYSLDTYHVPGYGLCISNIRSKEERPYTCKKKCGYGQLIKML